jgi:rod shape determining protein RodA
MLSRRLLRNLDIVTIVVTVLLIICSLMIIGSATHVNNPSEDRYYYVQRQGLFAIVNLFIVFFMLHFD